MILLENCQLLVHGNAMTYLHRSLFFFNITSHPQVCDSLFMSPFFYIKSILCALSVIMAHRVSRVYRPLVKLTMLNARGYAVILLPVAASP